jgi:hypothetical protein
VIPSVRSDEGPFLLPNKELKVGEINKADGKGTKQVGLVEIRSIDCEGAVRNTEATKVHR